MDIKKEYSYIPYTPEQKKQFKEKKDAEYVQNLASLFMKGMEENKLPWMQPWDPENNDRDYNLFSNNFQKEMDNENSNDEDTKKEKSINYYKGINGLLCELTRKIELNTEDPRWGTLNQIREYNKRVNDEKDKIFLAQDARPIPIKFYTKTYLDENGDVIKSKGVPNNYTGVRTVLRCYNVYNASQIIKYKRDKDGNKIEKDDGTFLVEKAFPYTKKEKLYETKGIKEVDKLIENTGVQIDYTSNDICAYIPSLDAIKMVNKDKFKSTELYYDTLFHELTHWTGHPSRLNREESRRYDEGNEWKAREELIAEIGGYLICKECNIVHTPSKNNIAYAQSWLKEITNKPDTLLDICKKAEKAKNYVIKCGKEKRMEKDDKSLASLALSTMSMSL